MMRLEDHAIVAAGQVIGRAGIASIIKLEARFREIMEAATLEDILAVMALSVSLIALDFALPGLKRIADLALLKRRFRDARIVVFVEDDTREQVIEALSAGASAVVSKSASSEDMRFALRQVLEGKIFVPPSLADPNLGSAASACPEGRTRQLTARQAQIVEMIGRGCTKKEVARALGLTERTVATHAHRAYRKLGVHGRLDAGRALLYTPA